MKSSRLAVIAVVFLTVAYVFLKSVVFPIILETHTAYLFLQIEEVLNKEEHAPVTDEALLGIVRASELDWNSCEMKGSEIRDAWGRAIKIEQHIGEWILQSSGKNGLFEDSDDISLKLKMTNKAQAGTL